ncbi:hypothetical protein WNZ15_00980 [Roseibium sp. AS2]|uniref:hypothetical protein n=1 Tax=Roseibium sp. AS2 TaxID=3135781 RepID=UPI00317CD65D
MDHLKSAQHEGGLPSRSAQEVNPPLDQDVVQAALVSTLQSPEFQSAPQLRSFLGFIVRATLANQQDKLKGYTIAVEALGRPEEFNPVTDPIVRVEAARLRRRLEKYYSGSGAGAAIRIVIPKGSYAPEFISPAAGRSPLPGTASVVSLNPDGHPGKSPVRTGRPSDRGSQSGPHPIAEAEPLPDDTKTGFGTEFETGRSDTPVLQDRAGPDTPSLSRLAHLPVPLPLAVLLAVICFFAGYLFAAG